VLAHHPRHPLVVHPARAVAPSAVEPSAVEPSAASQAIVAAPDRSMADRAMDPGRKPALFLDFLGVKPGMHVAELMAGGGYTSELLARAVAPTGVVYAENPKWVLNGFAEKPFSARLAKPVMKSVIRLDRELDDPFPADLHDLDLVVSNAIYHDTVWSNVDRARMNQAVFDALKPGGHYAICDSSAVAGHWLSDVKTLHRIDEQAVVQEVVAAGFQLRSKSDVLRNPADTRDWSASPGAAGARRGTSDRFCLTFVRP
jgi:predicted methyltransferase